MKFAYSILPGNEGFINPRVCELTLLPEKREAISALNILKVDVSPEPAVWRITLRGKPAVQSLLDDFAQGLSVAYNLREVIFEFSEESQDRLAFDREYLLGQIKGICPGSHFVLEKAKWLLNGNFLTITIDSFFTLERLRQKQIDKLVADFFNDNFPEPIKTNFILAEPAPICGDHPAGGSLPLPADGRTQEQLPAESGDRPKSKSAGKILYGKPFKDKPVPIAQVSETETKIVIEGTLCNFASRENRDGSLGVKFIVADNTDAITGKILFKSKKEYEVLAHELKEGVYARLCGKITNDFYEQNELVLTPRGIMLSQKAERLDKAAQKRVELHAHTKMSAMDSVMATESYVKRAASWGHPAAAITDHGVVQAFPEAYAAAKKCGIKVIFGLEGYLIEDWDAKSASWHIVILAATQKGL